MNKEVLAYEEDSLWQYFYKEFQGYEIIFRQNILTGLIQMKVTDEMAMANGYKSLSDLNDCISRDMGMIAILPDWMNLTEAEGLYSHLN